MKKKLFRVLTMSIIMALVLSTASLATNFYKDEEARLIYTSKELTILQTTTVTADIEYNGNKPLNWIQASLNFYPMDTYRQTVLEAYHDPKIYQQKPEEIIYRIQKPTSTVKIISEHTIQTKNEYKPITKKVSFPIQQIPSEYSKYLEFTELIDNNDDISATASLLASGKDDVFQIAQDIAIWITTNVRYDLTTITADANQKASWVLEHRYGVCDELSVLYISMLRSLGIPARMVSGIAYTNSELFDEPWNPHAWVEVYFSEQGWIPFDLTYNQFGYVDASHIKLADSSDADSLATSFQWEGFMLDDIDVTIQETMFDITVIDAKGLVADPITITTELLYTEVGFGSYNILEIHAENTQAHYVSSAVYVSAPKEIIFERETIPMYLKPKETKTYYVLMRIPHDLDPAYIYTIPVGAYTPFGYESTSEFTVEARHHVATIQQVNSYLKNTAPEQNIRNEITITCELSDTKIYVGEESIVTCIIKNTGNTYLTNGTICLESKDITSTNPCEHNTIPINQDISFKRILLGNTLGSKEFAITANFVDFSALEKYSFIVTDTPNISITDILLPEVITFGDSSNMSIQLSSKSITNPEQITLYVTIGSRTRVWDIDSIRGEANFIIPIDSRILDEKDTDIHIKVTWSDDTATTFETTRIITTRLSPLTFWQKIMRIWYKLVI